MAFNILQRWWGRLKDKNASTPQPAPNGGWKPMARKRRVEFMVTGDPSRIQSLAEAIDTAQDYFTKASGHFLGIESRVTAFLDECLHRTKWNTKPMKTSARARRMHCEQTRTKFTEAFAQSACEAVDDIILIGHRFDDDVVEVLAQAEKLKAQGVHIHCFHTGKDKESREVFEKLAQSCGGVFLQLTDQSQLNQVMPIMMEQLNKNYSMEQIGRTEAQAEALQKLTQKLIASFKPKNDQD